MVGGRYTYNKVRANQPIPGTAEDDLTSESGLLIEHKVVGSVVWHHPFNLGLVPAQRHLRFGVGRRRLNWRRSALGDLPAQRRYAAENV